MTAIPYTTRRLLNILPVYLRPPMAAPNLYLDVSRAMATTATAAAVAALTRGRLLKGCLAAGSSRPPRCTDTDGGQRVGDPDQGRRRRRALPFTQLRHHVSHREGGAPTRWRRRHHPHLGH